MALAEEYRGCFPTTWAILNGEKRAGVTLHYIDQGVDSGDIIAQTTVPMTEETTGKSLYDNCTVAGLQLFKTYFPLVEQGTAPRRPQIKTDNTKNYPRVFPSQEIDFSKSGEEILRHIRANIFPPYPSAYFYIGGRKYIIQEEERDD
jgi:methionyl-tRNA formyltransferase